MLSDYFSSHQEEVESKRILELGAGAALPSLVFIQYFSDTILSFDYLCQVCCRLGASFVLITDFPDDDIISNINDLVKHNSVYGHCEVCGYIWGDDVKGLLSAGVVSGHGTELYDVIIMAELLWGDTYSLHENILTSACQCLKQDGAIYVSFAKRPLECTSSLKGQHDDDDFFRLAVKFGLSISEISCTKMSDVCSTEKVDVRLIILRKCGMKHSCSDSNRK